MVASWRQRQRQELHQRLYRAAVELFSSQGYDSTTVQQITERVGVAKGTFFNHFPSKEHVVAEWYHGITSGCLERAQERAEASAEERICSLVRDMAGRAAEMPELALAKAQHSSHELLVEAEKVQDQEIDAFFHRWCHQGKASGELVADLDADLFVGLVGSVLTGTSREWVRACPRFDFPRVVEARVRFLFRAARAAQA